ncbi:sulfite exporter TauE/SafE family protein [Inquilinus sp. OTU3971]|uniref:sulfite exporter TauE/SafE family protein n=1 Tax=Inquilinus sp. OTU3971 TaxID=3043855 RepID=UPI00313EEAB3
MSFDLATLAALCGPGWTGPGALGLFGAMALAGLAGSLMHCGPMCGGFVLAQVGRRLSAVPMEGLCEGVRVGQGLLPGYHLGRLATYAGLGGAAGGIGGGLVALPWFNWLSAALLALGAAMLLALALRLHGGAGRSDGSWARRLADWTRPLLFRPTGWRAAGLGILLGFLPCGLLYAALAAAAGTGGAVPGALAMLSFGLGTVPLLVAIGIAGEAAGRKWRRGMMRLAPAMLAFNAVLLGFLALRAAL